MKTDYTPEFCEVWDTYRAACFLDPVGSKKNAFKVWIKEKLINEKDNILEAIRITKSNNEYRLLKDKKAFIAQWKHFENWLKGEEWEDLIDLREIEKQKKGIRSEPPALPDYSRDLARKMKPVEVDTTSRREELYQQAGQLLKETK